MIHMGHCNHNGLYKGKREAGELEYCSMSDLTSHPMLALKIKKKKKATSQRMQATSRS